MGKGLVGKVQE